MRKTLPVSIVAVMALGHSKACGGVLATDHYDYADGVLSLVALAGREEKGQKPESSADDLPLTVT